MDWKRRKMFAQILILLAITNELSGQQPTDFAVPTSGTVNLLINPSVDIIPTNQTDLTSSKNTASSGTTSTDMVIAPPSQSTILDLMEKYSNVVNASSGTTSNFPIRVQDPTRNVNILQSSPEWSGAPASQASRVNLLSVPTGTGVGAGAVTPNLIGNLDISTSSTQQSQSGQAAESSPVTASGQNPSSVLVDSFIVGNTLGQSMPLKEMISAANPTPSSEQFGFNPLLDTQPVVDPLPNPQPGAMDLPPLLELSAFASTAPNDSLPVSNLGFDTSVVNEPLAIGGSNFPSSDFSVLSSPTESQPLPTSTVLSQSTVIGPVTTGEQASFGPPVNVPADQLRSFSSNAQQPSSGGSGTVTGSESLTNVQIDTMAGEQFGKTNVVTGNEPINQPTSHDAIPLDLQNIPKSQTPFQANSGAVATDINQPGTQSAIDLLNVNVNQQTYTPLTTPPAQSDILLTDILTSDFQSNSGFPSPTIPPSPLHISNIHQSESIPTQNVDQQIVVTTTPVIDTQNAKVAQSGSNPLGEPTPTGSQGSLRDTLTSSNQHSASSSGMNRGNILNFQNEPQPLNIPQAFQPLTPQEFSNKQSASPLSPSSSQQNPPIDSGSSTITNVSTTINLTEMPVPSSFPVGTTGGQQGAQNSNTITSLTQVDLISSPSVQGQQSTGQFQPEIGGKNPAILPLDSQQPLLQQNPPNQVPNQVDPSAMQPSLSNQLSGGPQYVSKNTEQNSQMTSQENLANQFPNQGNPMVGPPTPELSSQQFSGSPALPMNPQILPSTHQQNYDTKLPNLSSNQNLPAPPIATPTFQPQNERQNHQMLPSNNQQQPFSSQLPNIQNSLQPNHSPSFGENSQPLTKLRNQLNANSQQNLAVQQNGQLTTETAPNQGAKTIQNPAIPQFQGIQQSTNQQSVYPYSVNSQQSIPNQPVNGIIQSEQVGSAQPPAKVAQQTTNTHTQQTFQRMPNANFQNLQVTKPSDSSPIGNTLNQGVHKNIHNFPYRTANIPGASGHIGQNPLVQLRNMYRQASLSGKPNANVLPNQYSGIMQGLSGHNRHQFNNANAQAGQIRPNPQLPQPVNQRNYYQNYFPPTNVHNPAGFKSSFEKQIVQNNLRIKPLPNTQFYASSGANQMNVASPNPAWSPTYQNQVNSKPKINKNREWDKFAAFQAILNASPAHVLRQASLPSKSTEQQLKTSRAAQIPQKTSQNIYWGSYTRSPAEPGIQDFKLPSSQMQTAQAVQTPPQLSTQNLSKLTRPLPIDSYQGLSRVPSGGLQSNNTPRDFAARLPALQTQSQVLATSPQMVGPQAPVNVTTGPTNVSSPPSKPLSQPPRIIDSTVGAQAGPDLAALRQLAGNTPVTPVVPRRKALLYAQGSRSELPTGAAAYRNTGSTGNNMLMNMMLMQRLEQMAEGGGPQMNMANMMKLLNPRAAGVVNAPMKSTTQTPPRTLTEALGYYDPIMKEFIPKQAVYGPELAVKRTPAKPSTLSTGQTRNYAAMKGRNPTFNKAMAVIENARLKAFNQIKQQPRPFLLNQFFQWKNRSGTAATAPKITEFVQYLKETITKVMPLFIPSHTQQTAFKRSAENQNSYDQK